MLLIFCIVALGVGVRGQFFTLDARKAWQPGSTLQDEVADGVILQSASKTETECYSGNEKYLRQSVLCDRQCIADVEAVARASNRPDDFRDSEQFCNGPWYCSRTEICEMFRAQETRVDAGISKPCTTVYGCANHSQCFPTKDDMHLMRINMKIDEWTDEEAIKIRDDGFTIYYGGMKMTTTCCVNNRKRQSNYRLQVDIPCNASSPSHTRKALYSCLLLSSLLFILLFSSFSSL